MSNSVDAARNGFHDLIEKSKTAILDFALGLQIKNDYDSKEKHHIVAQSDWRAGLARWVLAKDDVNIGINSKQNTVAVKEDIIESCIRTCII